MIRATKSVFRTPRCTSLLIYRPESSERGPSLIVSQHWPDRQSTLASVESSIFKTFGAIDVSQEHSTTLNTTDIFNTPSTIKPSEPDHQSI